VGTYQQTVVDLDVSAQEASTYGRRGREWLENEGIIRAVPWRGDMAYLAGPRWREAVEVPSWDWRAGVRDVKEEPCGELRVVTGRTVFAAAPGPAVPAICPRCAAPVPDGPVEAIGTWYETGSADVDCPACGRDAPLRDWEWTDDCVAFGYLGFQLDDWPPLRPRFADSLRRALGGHRVRVVAGKS